MILQGKLVAESPIYRVNARKTLYTRDGDGTQRLVSLAGEVAGTAESLMDAFIGRSRNGKNIGLLNQLWLRLYGSSLPEGLITKVECRAKEESYPKDRFFDLRMGIKLDEDRWAAEANANYKMETLFRNTEFDLTLHVDDSLLKKDDHATQLYYILQELKEGKFWFGAGKSKGLGRCRLEMDFPFSPSDETRITITTRPGANHLEMSLMFNSANPVMVGWNWGKVDPEVPAFAAIEGRFLVEAMRNLPEPIRKRLEMVIGGPILSPEDWKRKLSEYLPKSIGIWLMERAESEKEVWIFPKAAVAKLAKGKYALSPKLLEKIQPLVDQPFPGKEAAESALNEALGAKANMGKRILDVLQYQKQVGRKLDREAWSEIAEDLGLDKALEGKLAEQIQNENKLVGIISQACQKIMPQLYQQVDRQINLLQSDPWVDEEIRIREEHLRIKDMLIHGGLDEQQWGNPNLVPEGIRASTWKEFVEAHKRVTFYHMSNAKNLRKSITNDENHIAFLKAYRNQTRQELTQPYNTDFRAGGAFGREISRKYGKPYDTVFMRMLSWSSSSQGQGLWEIYIPGSTIKGAFRKRASQVVKTLWGESARTSDLLNRLFGTQGQRGLVFFSDAYLKDSHVPERSWCSMDGVRMDPSTGRPIEEAKADYLFAYGNNLSFHLRLDIQDMDQKDEEAFSLLVHLLEDFQRGDIPLGGEKSCGFGWVTAMINEINWKSTSPDGLGGLGKKLFGKVEPQDWIQEGVWRKLNLKGESIPGVLKSIPSLFDKGKGVSQSPPRAKQGFISHRSFGGYCGTLAIEAKVLTPLMVQESGEPSYRAKLDDQPADVVNGWDFFSMSSPVADLRNTQRVYALPSKSLKGMIRHIYSIASDSQKASVDLGLLNPVDSLFGFVGKGPNQALMGRLSFSFGLFESPELAWFKVPYPYGAWRYKEGKWQKDPEGTVTMFQIDKKWRLFPHAPLAPAVKQLESLQPDTAKASYSRAILPEAPCRFSVRFWNLEKEELQRLLWCLVLEEGLAHKIGKNRYLGFGSFTVKLLSDSFLIDWPTRYDGKTDQKWRMPILRDQWIDTKSIKHYAELRKALYAQEL